MPVTSERASTIWRLLHWVARVTSVAAVVPLMMIVFGEPGSGPGNVREWVYLALFPFGFSAGSLLGLRWPVTGGCIALGCMLASQIVLWHTFPMSAYLFWGVLCLPGVLYLAAGWGTHAAETPKAPSVI